MGADITAHTHVYAKLGASAADFVHKLFVVQGKGDPIPIASFQQTQRSTIWGWLLGVGLAHDVSKWFSMFAEYDHFDYGTRNLDSLDNIDPGLPPNNSIVDRLTQHVGVSANTVRVGLNVMFKF